MKNANVVGFRNQEVESAGGSASGLITRTTKNGVETTYNASADTDVARGTALLLAVSEAVSGDTLHLSGNTFDIANNYIDTSIGGTGHFHLCGSGKYNTVIKSSYGDNGGILQPIIVASTNGCVNNLSIIGTASAGTYQACWGIKDITLSSSILNAKIENVYMEAGTDCIYFIGKQIICHVNKLTSASKWDSVIYSPGSFTGLVSEIHITNSVITSTADVSVNTGLVARGLIASNNGDTNMILNVSDTIITVTNGSTTTTGVLNGSTSTVNLNNVKIVTSSSGGTILDIYNDAYLAYANVNIDCIYDTTKTSGTITSVGVGNDVLLKINQTTPQIITATDVAITTADEVYYGDATDSFKIKKDTVQGILDLVPPPDLSGYVPYTGADTDVDLGSQNIVTTGIGSFQQVNSSGGLNALNGDGSGQLADGLANWDISGNFTAASLTETTPTLLKLDQTTPQQITGSLAITSPITGALVLGDITGDARGIYATDIQSYRSDITRVASGENATALGYDNIASKIYSTALGYYNSALGSRSCAVGYINYSDGIRALTFGTENLATASRALAFGRGNSVAGAYCGAFGSDNIFTADNSNTYLLGEGNTSDLAQGAFVAGNKNTISGVTSGIFGYRNAVTGDNGYAIGIDIANLQDNLFALGTSTNTLFFNANGFSINNENPLSKAHMTGKLLVTDISSLGSELCTNHDFTGSATGWTLGTGWSYYAGFVSRSPNVTLGTLSQAISITAGKYYYIIVEHANLAVGSFTITLGGVTAMTLKAKETSGTILYSKAIVKASTNGGIIIAPVDALADWDYINDISVKEIIGGDIETLGGFIGKITDVATTYTILSTDDTVICDKTSAFTVTLPTAVLGRKYTIKNIGTGLVTIDGAGTDTIDDTQTKTLSQWDSMTIQCNATNKWIII